jgi:sugar phosphate permease
VRSVLNIVTPDMLDSGYSTEYIGLVSTVFMITYGVGQLLNGMIGDRIKAKTGPPSARVFL